MQENRILTYDSLVEFGPEVIRIVYEKVGSIQFRIAMTDTNFKFRTKIYEALTPAQSRLIHEDLGLYGEADENYLNEAKMLVLETLLEVVS